MFVMIIGQGIVSPFFKFVMRYLEIKQKFIQKLYQWNYIKKEKTALRLIKGRQVPFVWSYSLNTKLVWFGFIYGVVSPICLLISAIALLLSYFY